MWQHFALKNGERSKHRAEASRPAGDLVLQTNKSRATDLHANEMSRLSEVSQRKKSANACECL